MTINSVTLTNPGAESGSATGWTTRSGASPSVSTTDPHSGTYKFVAGSSNSVAQWDQQITVDSGLHTAIDAGDAAFKAMAWHKGAAGNDDDGGFLYVEFYSSGLTLLGSNSNSETDPSAWTQESILDWIPSGTRYIRIGTYNIRRAVGSEISSYWDDFTLEISDDGAVDYPVDARATQLGAYVWGTFPSDSGQAHQVGTYAFSASETSSGLYQVKAHQLGAYAWVKGFPDRRDMRAWTFTQDDHDFYVLQLGDALSLVYDKLTKQYATWHSSGYNYWRGDDGVDWEGFNVCCDRLSGRIFKIDATGRLDYNTSTEENDTPIASKVTGQVTVRFRQHVPCYMAELALSEKRPPTGIEASSVGIQLRTSDDDGQNWTDHGTIDGEALGEEICVRWNGLGLMVSPGRSFELTDTGYARRIDALTLEVGNG